jgi:hypothetical protein
MSDTPADLRVLSVAVRPAERPAFRRMVAEALLANLVLVWILALLLPRGTGGITDPIEALRDLTVSPLWFWVPAGLLTWLVWSVAGGAIQRAAILEVAGLPTDTGRALRHALRRAISAFAAPFFLLAPVAALLALVLVGTQVVRIPYAGWPLLVLLLPVLFVLARSAVRLLLRWLLAGHLAGPAIAEGSADAFGALSRAFAFFRVGPWPTLRVRALGFVVFLGRSVAMAGVAAAAFALIWLLVRDRLPEDGVGFVVSLLLAMLVGAWLLAVPVATFLAVRTGGYLLLRRELDGVPADAKGAWLEPEPTLEELGFRLVQRLREESEAAEREQRDQIEEE